MMRTFKTRTAWVALGTTILATPIPAVAADPQAAPPSAVSPAALDSAHKLIALMHVDRTVDMMFEQLLPLMAEATVGALEAGPKTANLMKAMESAKGGSRTRLLAIFREEFSTELKQMTPTLLDRVALEYAAAFSERELNDLVNFYSSGTGEKVVSLVPELQKKMAAFGQMAGQEAGRKAGERAMKRAIGELLPAAKTKS